MLKLAVYNAPRSCDLQEKQQTSDFHLREQAPGKWASIAKKNVPEQKKMPNPAASRSAAQEPSPAAATAPTSAPVDASASSPKAAPAAVLPIAAPAEATAAAAHALALTKAVVWQTRIRSGSFPANSAGLFFFRSLEASLPPTR